MIKAEYKTAQISTADYEHIHRIETEINWWAASCEGWCGFSDYAEIERERVLPAYLLIAYTQNILNYWKMNFGYPVFADIHRAKGGKTTKRMILGILGTIEETVMRSDFEDMELRATILRMYHDAGYQTAGQMKLEL